MAEVPVHPDARIMRRLTELAQVFRPSGPIDHQDLFSGRSQQLLGLNNIVADTGRHAIIFGERGVGKTSLAAVAAEIQSARQQLCLRVNCDQTDTFASIWTKVIDEVNARALLQSWRWGDPGRESVTRAIELLSHDEITPDRVRHFLRILTDVAPTVVVLDEFDRLAERETSAAVADTIKTLSDQLVPATLVLVGVADTVDSLIAQHQSVERALGQVRMPRMTPDEIAGIYSTGFGRTELRIGESTLRRLTVMPQGLPHFAHLLGLEAATPAILEDRDEVSDEDVRHSVEEAVDKADESMTRAYTEATTSAHQTLFESVVLAAALADADGLGFFAPGDLRLPLQRITGEAFDIPRYARHLVQLCNERGPLLERRGGEHRWRYRFVNPMMRPYVVMRAAKSGVSESALGIDLSSEPLPPS